MSTRTTRLGLLASLPLLAASCITDIETASDDVGPLGYVESAASGSDYVKVALQNIEPNAAEQAAGFSYNKGIPSYATLHVDWYNWSNGVGNLQSDCSFTVTHEADGTLTRSNNNVEIIDDTANNLTYYKLDAGCDARGGGDNNSYFHVYTTWNFPANVTEDDVNLAPPIALTEVKIKDPNHTKTRSNFRVKPTLWGMTSESWSAHQGCANTDFRANPDDGDATKFSAVDVSNDFEGTTGSAGGAVIFPSRVIGGSNWALTFCDSGWLKDNGKKFPDPNDASFNTADWYTGYPALPEVDQYNYNTSGEGLSYLNHVSDAGSNEDALAILSYNTSLIPSSELGGNIAKGRCFLLGHCKANQAERHQIAHEIGAAIQGATFMPDVLVLSEVFQDRFSGFGHDNWDDRTVQNALLSHLHAAGLSELSSQAPVQPEDPVHSVNKNPVECANWLTPNYITTDIASYPGADATKEIKVCGNPPGNALNSGVLIMYNSARLTLLDSDYKAFKSAQSVDMGAAKGVTYAELQKNGAVYKVFGTHLQSSKDLCASRVAQVRELVDFVASKMTAPDDRVVIVGDLNIGPRVNIHYGQQSSVDPEKSEVCRNELEQLLQRLRRIVSTDQPGAQAGRVQLSRKSLPFSNDCEVNELVGKRKRSNCDVKTSADMNDVGDKSKVLDHVLWAGATPPRSGSTIVRQLASGSYWTGHAGENLSGHFPMITLLSYDDAFSAHEHYYAPHTIPYPLYCPYVGTRLLLSTGNTGQPNTESEWVCRRVGETLTNADIVNGEGERKYCGHTQWSNDHNNFVAPCIIAPGYTNLATWNDATVTASSSLSSKFGPNNLVDGRVQIGSAAGWASNWSNIWVAADSGPQWVTIEFPVEQYVKRIRFRNAKAMGGRGTLGYNLYYENASQGWQPIAVGATTYLASDGLPDVDTWYMHELAVSVPTKKIKLECTSAWMSSCALGEIEVYGGPE